MGSTLRRWKQLVFHHEASPGVVLMAFAALALILDNSSLSRFYQSSILATPIGIQIGAFQIDKPALLWINDGLMAIFFFLVGLEIKRELIEGKLSSWKQASLPAIAAFGGMLLPGLIYVAINNGNATGLSGWAIPTATDIAFALGVLALLGSRVPVALKVFLLALAILDDLGAILIIAVFYTDTISLASLAVAVVGTALLWSFNAKGVTRIAPYIIVGIVMWVCVLKSGVHATIAGVIVALTIPLRARDGFGRSPLKRMETELYPWAAFGIMPLFAFANAGVSLKGLSLEDLFAPVPLAIAVGLFLGKQVGVFGFSWAAVRLGICEMPKGVTWRQMYGLALLAGIGFTMSLFIGTLAFSDPEYARAVRLGVLSGSVMSALCGYAVLRFATAPAQLPVSREVARELAA